MYNEIIKFKPNKPQIEEKYKDYDWKKIWNACQKNCIPTKWRTALYLALNDIYPTKIKLKKHKMSDSDKCITCNVVENLYHKIRDCGQNTRNCFNKTKTLILAKFGISLEQCKNVYELLEIGFNNNNEDKNTFLWYIAAMIYCNLELKDDVIKLVDIMRNDRWIKIRKGIINKFSNKIFGF